MRAVLVVVAVVWLLPIVACVRATPSVVRLRVDVLDATLESRREAAKAIEFLMVPKVRVSQENMERARGAAA